ncbi:hypothetical protein ACFL2G_03875 [Candidatus Omnitrophota bacterium]
MLNIGRIICHELWHILLRYKYDLPYIDTKKANYKQGMVLNVMDHRLFNPELDRRYGKRRDGNAYEEHHKKELSIIGPYLEKEEMVLGINRDKYFEILRKCMKALDEEMPSFVM